MILASSRLMLLGALMVMQPGKAHALAQDDAPLWEGPWDAHAAAAVLDASFESQDACEANLTRARAAESTPAADIDPRLRDLFTHASCTPVSGPAGANWALRLRWREDDAAG